ncbi:MAG TPA: BrnA antitoxin family protein [Candidatus Binatia bacterium]|nr:BrnA antitoxin family protein [Candidatus Binatia bacterium]
MKKRRGSSARGARAVKNEKRMKSKKINLTDIPELSDRQLSSMQRVGRPTMGDEPRKLITIRLDAKVLGWLRKTAEKKGLPYQSLVNDILASEMRKAS